MRLILIRHGDAEDYAASDFERNLTVKGVKQAKKVGGFLSEINNIDNAIILHSPYLRAVQTAKGIYEGASHSFTLVEDSRLGCGMSFENAFDVMKELPEEETIIFVGHQPDFGDLIGYLLGAHGGAVEVKKASVAIFQLYRMGAGGGYLEAFVPVKLM